MRMDGVVAEKGQGTEEEDRDQPEISGTIGRLRQ